MTVDEAIAADRKYSDDHPDEDEFVLDEFGAAELPQLPNGYSAHVDGIGSR
jgi:hypothetical protein